MLSDGLALFMYQRQHVPTADCGACSSFTFDDIFVMVLFTIARVPISRTCLVVLRLWPALGSANVTHSALNASRRWGLESGASEEDEGRPIHPSLICFLSPVNVAYTRTFTVDAMMLTGLGDAYRKGGHSSHLLAVSGLEYATPLSGLVAGRNTHPSQPVDQR